ncbi:16S rRNA (uracil1498-N3)-methyltransferase [Desulfosalsimonas propionicica]|uniref:Ribosomal RNA small subunit methyltransferase E n=1 Tax=Desulfosalsimonas propionicica TaxID=332175 RepID=A0A7W0C7I2_9BACT|nr:16S rRNA (uracil(1498)-N(3))-methyltransferase [Desulfosalsimonas propionicica]MBA2880591.1 16S rRNA (uracil1498-N3)-methyltransferase [Desulfosalsimonas propionicica]
MRRFYINPSELERPEPCITGKEARHLKTVLRLSAGDRIRVTNGAGRICDARIISIEEKTVRVVIENRIEAGNESPLDLIVAQGFLKDKKMDELVRHLTELGVTRWIPMMTRRTVARPDARRMKKRMERWQAISLEAIKQCGRSMVPEIAPVMDFSEVLSLGATVDARFFFWEQARAPLADTAENSPGAILLLLGPEGGFTENEAADAEASGFSAVSMGCRILRAETAAISACTLVQYVFGDLQKSP